MTYEEPAPLRNPATGEMEQRYFDTGISRINDGEGKPYGVFVQTNEVTERVETRKRIEDALRIRDTFLSIASHELRTPLTGAKLQAQLMKRNLANPQLDVARLRKMVDQIDRGLGRLARLIEDMLDISRIQSGKLALQPEATDLPELTRAVVDRFAFELAASGIQVAVRAEPGELIANVDRFRLEQVVTNLLTNAMKYAPGAPVTVGVRRADSMLELAVEDGGPGIPEKDRQRIFERFERLGSPSEAGGLGLGLFIVREIVQAHGGTIHAAGEPGRGARFVVRLPAT